LEEKAAAVARTVVLPQQATITMATKLVQKQGYLALEGKQKAPDIQLADVKVSVVTVMFTELKYLQ